MLCVAPHGESFEAWRDDLEYFAGPGALLAFPEPDTLPYDPSSPHPGITAQRLETLSRLAGGRARAWRGGADDGPRSGAEGAGARTAVACHRPGDRVGATLDPEDADGASGRARLRAPRPKSEAVGQFARRGGILDVYPVGRADPVRLEFDGDTDGVDAALRRRPRQRSLEQLTPRSRCCRGTRWCSTPSAPEKCWSASSAAGDPGAGLFHEGMERFAGHYDAVRAARCSITCPRARWW